MEDNVIDEPPLSPPVALVPLNGLQDIDEIPETKEEEKEELKDKVKAAKSDDVVEEREIIELNIELTAEEKENLTSITRAALDVCTTEKEIASYIKCRFDQEYNPGWNCIVGIPHYSS